MFLLPKRWGLSNKDISKKIIESETISKNEQDLIIRQADIDYCREIAWPTLPSLDDNTVRGYVARKDNLIAEPLYQAIMDKAIDNWLHISWEANEWLYEIKLWCRHILATN